MAIHTYYVFEQFFFVNQGIALLLVLSIIFLLAITAISVHQAESITQFYFNLPDQFKITTGTVFQAAYYDNDGEGIYFIWNFTGLKSNPYEFSHHADLIPDAERFNQTQSVKPQSESLHERYKYKFAIDENITIGSNFELCVQSNTSRQCEWPQPVDQFGRVLGDLAMSNTHN